MEVRIIKEDGDWYWIPEELLEDFVKYSDLLFCYSYYEKPELHDAFDDEFYKYRTLGIMSLVPEFYKDKDIKILKFPNE